MRRSQPSSKRNAPPDGGLFAHAMRVSPAGICRRERATASRTFRASGSGIARSSMAISAPVSRLSFRRNPIVYRTKPVAAAHVLNGFGKSAGLVQIEELGTIETPLLLTNTLAGRHLLHGAYPPCPAAEPRYRARDRDGESGGSRMQRRLAQRHPGACRHRGGCAGGARRRGGGFRLRRGRRGLRHERLRVQGRHRHFVPETRRELSSRRAGAGEFRTRGRSAPS